MNEKPGAQTPWMAINQLLAADERFDVRLPQWQGFLLAPKQPAQLAALLYLIREAGIRVCVQGRGTEAFPLAEHQAIISARAFSQIVWHEQGIVEVGAGCALSHVQQFLFEKDQEVALEGTLFNPDKRSVAALILTGQTGGIRYRNETFSETLLGIEFVTWEGSQVKWGGNYHSAAAGPALHKLVWDLQTFPGVIVKVFLKTYPRPPIRLQLAWKFHQREKLWEHFYALKDFSSTWEYLDAVISGNEQEPGFVLAQISGLPDEMNAFAEVCPRFAEATQKEERSWVKAFLIQKKVKLVSLAHCDSVLLTTYPQKREEYYWIQNWNQKTPCILFKS